MLAARDAYTEIKQIRRAHGKTRISIQWRGRSKSNPYRNFSRQQSVHVLDVQFVRPAEGTGLLLRVECVGEFGTQRPVVIVSFTEGLPENKI